MCGLRRLDIKNDAIVAAFISLLMLPTVGINTSLLFVYCVMFVMCVIIDYIID